ncbi:DUF3810 domain-containing protein [Abyssalbus ytuae]|uniref:DUF3810 domain-containing protein n=1 Tax=Abyssalbus ytuae TaxID=2926907 RepID=A0A9E7A1U0_9FLAO|nr:DUF3810 domain-containing protein [Abyssalbus ytuae]UOB18171.1 DUF3810 domain-containing protein [Abyssalbus ytuae]
MPNNIKYALAFSVLPQILIVKWLGNYPQFIESVYSNVLYQFISKAFRYVFGWIPFSVGDIFYTIAAVLIIRFLVTEGKFILKNPKEFFFKILTAISVLYFVFHLFWGMNYYRLPLHEKLNLSDEYTTPELIDFTERLITKTNQIHLQITKNDTLPVILPYSKSEVYKKAPKGFENLSLKYPDLSYHPKSIKTSLYSLVLTYMGFSGYLNPFTNEGQVNGLKTDFKYPFVTCHEISHQIGYSAENEANFLGFLGAINNDDIYFKYAAYAYVLRYCLSEIYITDEKKYEEMNDRLNKGIIKNYIESNKFWAKYNTGLKPAFKNTFNAFLKANNQTQGIKSYSYVVTLLVNYYKNSEL